MGATGDWGSRRSVSKSRGDGRSRLGRCRSRALGGTTERRIWYRKRAGNARGDASATGGDAKRPGRSFDAASNAATRALNPRTLPAMYSCLGSAMVPHAMPVLEGKSVVLFPAQSAGERAPEAVATPATEVRAPEPTPVAPHERERRSTPPIPAPRVSWRLLLLISSDTARPSLSESTAIFRRGSFQLRPRVRFRECRIRGKLNRLDRVDHDGLQLTDALFLRVYRGVLASLPRAARVPDGFATGRRRFRHRR